MLIKFNTIIVDTIESHSGIFIGDNDVSGRCSISKTQELVGGIKGIVTDIDGVIGYIDDSDYIDMPTFLAECDEEEFKINKRINIQHPRKNKKPKKF
jgi:hypothetical protein